MSNAQPKEKTKKKPPRGVVEREPGSGVWWIRYTDELKKRRWKVIGSYSMACKAVESQRTKVRLVSIAPELLESQKKQVSLAMAMDHVIDNSTVAARSLREEIRYRKMWAAAFPNLLLSQITAIEVAKWIAKEKRRVTRLGTPVKPASIARALAFLSKVYTVARKARWVRHNPVFEADRVKGVKGRKNRPLSLEEVRAVCDCLEDDARKMFLLSLVTGLRQHEQFGLRRDQCFLDLGHLALPTPKAQEQQYVQLPTEAIDILREALASHQSKWVFPRAHDPSLHIDGQSFYRYVFKRALKDAGISGVTWHSNRHFFASMLADSGEDPHVIRALMRHDNLTTTEGYLHSMRESPGRKAVQRLSSLVIGSANGEK